jgi:ribonuclease Z
MFKNELIILTHFSTRYHDKQLQAAVEQRLPETLRERVKLWM